MFSCRFEGYSMTYRPFGSKEVQKSFQQLDINVAATCSARSLSRVALAIETEVAGLNSSVANIVFHSGWASPSKRVSIVLLPALLPWLAEWLSENHLVFCACGVAIDCDSQRVDHTRFFSQLMNLMREPRFRAFGHNFCMTLFMWTRRWLPCLLR